MLRRRGTALFGNTGIIVTILKEVPVAIHASTYELSLDLDTLLAQR
jgi:hypothetical protein